MLRQSDNISVSVIITAFGESPFVEETLACFAEQLEENDELIVFHNGTDSWGSRVEENHGVQYTTYSAGRKLCVEDSWSHALMLGKADWVLWMHDDDILREGALKILKDAVAAYPEAVVACSHKYSTFSSNAPEWSNLPLCGKLSVIDSETNLSRYLFSHQHICSGMLIKRSVLQVVLPIPADFGAANDVWLYQRIAFHGAALVLQDVLVGYRSHSDSSTSRYLSTFSGKRAWTRSKSRQRADCCHLLEAKGMKPENIAAIACNEQVDIILDTLRSLLRARSDIARPLAISLAKECPGLVSDSGWFRIRIALVLGPLSLELTGLLHMLYCRLAGSVRRLCRIK